jgi:hypothetical protein
MTEHKFTDEEIIRALEICQKAKCWGDCKDMGCPAATKQGCRFHLRTDEDYEGVIQDEMLKDALDLINRQKEEIAKLEAMIDAAEEHFAPLPFKNKFDEYIEKSKAEAIEEFAERLIERAYTSSDWSHGEHPQVVECDDINEIVEELTEKGDNNGQKEN